MTIVNMKYEDGVVFVSGISHATGSPETCNGISSLFYALEGYLANNEIKVKNHVSDFRPGYAFIEFEPLSSELVPILQMFYIGISQIVNTYDEKFAKIRVDDTFLDFISGE